MRLSEKVKIVLNSDISAYKIRKETGIDTSTISRLRKGESKIENTTLGIAERLEDLYNKYLTE